MLVSHKLQLRLSSIRERLNVLSGVETLDAEKRSELDALEHEFQDKESQFRAAIIAESADAEQRGSLFGSDSEMGEIRSLRQRTHLGDYMTPASAGGAISGPAAELNAALKMPIAGQNGGVLVPWAMMSEERAAAPNTTTTATTARQVNVRPILPRLFGPGILDLMGVQIQSVPVGTASVPLVSGGVVPSQKAEGVDATDPVAATFGTAGSLQPLRLTGQYEFTVEAAATIPGIEEALRLDLTEAVRSEMSRLILQGDKSTNAQEPDGFFHTLTAPTAPSDVVDFPVVAGLPASAVDGIHATEEGEVIVLLGVDSYKKFAALYRVQGGSDLSGLEVLQRRSLKAVSSSFIPAVASTLQGGILHAAGPNGGGPGMRSDSIAAMWLSLELLRDPYSKAKSGVTILTWNQLWDARTNFRSGGAYKRVSFKLST